MSTSRPRSPIAAGLGVAAGGLLLGAAVLAFSGRWSSPVALPPNPDPSGSDWAVPLGPREVLPEDPPFLVSAMPLDLGTVVAGATATGRLTIANPGRRPLEIQAIRPLCSCLSIAGGQSPASVGPGQTRTIEVRMESPEQPAQTKTKKIRIVSRRNDPMDVRVVVHTAGSDAG